MCARQANPISEKELEAMRASGKYPEGYPRIASCGCLQVSRFELWMVAPFKIQQK